MCRLPRVRRSVHELAAREHRGVGGRSILRQPWRGADQVRASNLCRSINPPPFPSPPLERRSLSARAQVQQRAVHPRRARRGLKSILYTVSHTVSPRFSTSGLTPRWTAAKRPLWLLARAARAGPLRPLLPAALHLPRSAPLRPSVPSRGSCTRHMHFTQAGQSASLSTDSRPGAAHLHSFLMALRAFARSSPKSLSTRFLCDTHSGNRTTSGSDQHHVQRFAGKIKPRRESCTSSPSSRTDRISSRSFSFSCSWCRMICAHTRKRCAE